MKKFRKIAITVVYLAALIKVVQAIFVLAPGQEQDTGMILGLVLYIFCDRLEGK